MTHDKKQELHFLSVLKKRTDKNSFYLKAQLLADVFTGVMVDSRAYDLFDIFKKQGYLDEGDHSKDVGVKIYRISDAGRWYLETLEEEKVRDEADLKLKQISASSINFNKYFPAVATAIAIIAIAAPILTRLFCKEEIKLYKLDEVQIQQVLTRQDSQKLLIQHVHLDLISLDTSINALSKKIKVGK